MIRQISVVAFLLTTMVVLLLKAEIVHGQNTLKKENSPTFYLNPKWSPDGKMIAFASNVEGKLSVYTISSTESDMKRITDSNFESGTPNWSSDGNSLVYHKIVEDGILKLFIYSFESGIETQVTKSETIDYGASWLANTILCFNSRQNLDDINHNIYTLDIASHDLSKITDSKFDYSAPVWSSNGKMIACIKSILMTKSFAESTQEELSGIRNSSEVVLLNIDMPKVQNLTNDAFPNKCPSFSKNGRYIYYISQENSNSIFVQQKLKTGKKHFLLTLAENINNFNVSPDGKSITYSTRRNGHYAIYIWDISKMKECLLVGEL